MYEAGLVFIESCFAYAKQQFMLKLLTPLMQNTYFSMATAPGAAPGCTPSYLWKLVPRLREIRFFSFIPSTSTGKSTFLKSGNSCRIPTRKKMSVSCRRNALICWDRGFEASCSFHRIVFCLRRTTIHVQTYQPSHVNHLLFKSASCLFRHIVVYQAGRVFIESCFAYAEWHFMLKILTPLMQITYFSNRYRACLGAS